MGKAARRLRSSAVAGMLVWLAAGAYFYRLDPFIGLLRAILSLGALVIVPLGLSQLAVVDRAGREPRLLARVSYLQPPAALLAVVSLALPFGELAGALALPWLAVTGLVALHGVARAAARPAALAEERCIDAALVYLPIGGVWLVFWSWGRTLLGFDGAIVLLTAIHFHFAGFAAPLVAGLAGRSLAGTRAWSIYRVAALLVSIGPPLIAIGITASPIVEVVASAALAAGMLTLGGLLVFAVAARALPRMLLALAALALTMTMALACLYAYGEWQNRTLVGLDTMAATHGIANAIGFSLSALTAFALLAPAARGARPGIPMSRLASRGRIGPRFFDDGGLAIAGEQPAGLVDDFAAYACPGFDPTAVDDEVRAFYERTAECRLHVVPRWRAAFALPARLFRALARRVGQLGLPLDPVDDERMRGTIQRLDDHRDGRAGVRGWLRTYVDSGEVVYAAAYAMHEEAGARYMNIAFPLPFCNMTSVLRLDHGSLAGSVVLSSLARRERPGDEGVYLASSLGLLRLPFDETITVWSTRRAPLDVELAAAEDATVLARHDMWLFGIHYLTLHYALVPKGQSTSVSRSSK